MDDKHLEELFAPPIGLELEAVVDGQKLYSSQRLKEEFIKSMGASGRASHIFKQVEKLVMKKKLIVPCYLSKNMYRFFKHRLFGNPADKSILGFYHLEQKKVFILIENTDINKLGSGKGKGKISKFISKIPTGTVNNDFLASTTMHECVHLYADRMQNKFTRLFNNELTRYYISCQTFSKSIQEIIQN